MVATKVEGVKQPVQPDDQPTISDFFAHRWGQAKAKLSKLDPAFVLAIGNELPLNEMGLVVPWPSTDVTKPRVRLSAGWHQLLEACVELKIQADCLETAAVLLTPSTYNGRPPQPTGKEAVYHFRSWFVHAAAVAERTEAVIEKMVELFAKNRKGLAKRLRGRVYREISSHVDKQRQDYLHGFRRSWVSGITEDQLWEGNVAVGLLPEMLVEQFFYPKEGQDTHSGKHSPFATVTNELLARVGRILDDLETELGLAESRL
jgi:hypothetical protein